MMVVGGPGVGKTRLIERLQERKRGEEEEGREWVRSAPVSTDGVDVGQVLLREV